MHFTRFNPRKAAARCIATFFCIVIFLFAAKGTSQLAGTGSIQGIITDNTEAVIQNASVTVTNTATLVQHMGNTDANGLYSFPNLPIGIYTIEVAAPSFEHYRQSNVVLEVGSSISINIKMTVGGAVQEVEVHASDLALQTEDSSFKQTIDEKTASELPLNGRQITSLITLSGASANANENSDMQGSKTFYSSVVISVGGGQGDQTDYRLDGGDHNDYMTNLNLPFPFPDAIAEFSVETSAMSAQKGLHPGGLVNVVTRSGTDQWHGSAFEFIRNNYINATNFFSTAKDTLHQNQYGGTFGGKVIPRKLFFFAGYQRTGAAQSQALTKAYVPTAANLAGDFSVTDGAGCVSGGKAIQLLNPQTGAVLPSNYINPSLFTASALALQKYLPATTDPCGAVNYAIPSRIAENQFISRADWTINSKHSLYGRYMVDGYQSPAFFSPTNVLITTQAGLAERAQGLTLGETYVRSSNMVNSFHATATRRVDDRGLAAKGISPTTIGVNMFIPNPLGIIITTTNKWSAYCSTCMPANFNVNTFSFADDVNWIHGKHQIGFGGEFVRSQLNVNNAFEENGFFTFSGVHSQKGPAGTSTGGTGADANLDFLTGSLHSLIQTGAQQQAARAPIPSLYVLDTYHATNKVVISAGIRWNPEYFPPDYFGRGSTFNMNAFMNNTFSTVFPNAPAGSLYYGDAGVPKAMTSNSLWQFSPRLGATWDPAGNGKMVIRAGAGIVYDQPNLFTAQHINQNPPFSPSVTNTATNTPLNFASPWSSGTITTDPFPQPWPPKASTVFPNNENFYILPLHFHPPYAVQYTASIQRNFGLGWQLQLDYVGSKTTHLVYMVDLDPAVYIPGMCGTTACSTTGNSASRYALTILNPAQGPKYQGGGGNTGSSGSAQAITGANATYNGLVISIQHRMSSNFVFLANYTWSHCIDINDDYGDLGGKDTVENSANYKADRGNCGFDYRDVFNSTLVASSHFSLSGWKTLAFNNWQISPLVRVLDGTPFTVVSGVDNSLTAQNNDRPNLTNASVLYTHSKILSGASTNAQYINAAAFTQNATGTFGDSGRFAYRGPKFLQVDSALSRAIPLHERLTLNLRIEAFNVLNHPNFAAPGSSGYNGSITSLVSSTFGQVTATPVNSGARIFQGAVKLTF